MPPVPILDPQTLPFDAPIATLADIQALNPHRHEFQLLDAVLHFDIENVTFAGYYDATEDAWWTKGHVPGRPLLPGVLMVEAAAQLSSYAFHKAVPGKGFLGFTGIDDVKFRGVVSPPARLVLVGRGRDIRPRRFITEVQGFVDGSMVFEAVITGMPV